MASPAALVNVLVEICVLPGMLFQARYPGAVLAEPD